MPAYDFQCNSCETIFEERRPFSRAGEPAECPECGSGETHKLLTSISYISNGATAPAGNPDSIPLSMGSGGCGCGSCGCQT